MIYKIVDLGFGDAGKGTTVDFLSRFESTMIIRYSGGPQAAHNVVTDTGIHHTFAQFGSGSFSPNVQTYLSRYMWIDPITLINEGDALNRKGVDAYKRIHVDIEAPIITPFHKSANRIKERVNRHGSCGMGMGEAVADSLEGLQLKVSDLIEPDKALKKLKDIQEKKRVECESLMGEPEEWRLLDDTFAPKLALEIYCGLFCTISVAKGIKIQEGSQQVIFEGAGGLLLDENHGFHPHTMWSNTTTENADKMCNRGIKLGIIRTYSTRHGNGPFVCESLELQDKHNITNEYQGKFRTGYFDLEATKYALKVNPVDALVITHLDMEQDYICRSYVKDDKPYTLEVTPKGDLAKREAITNELYECKPVFTKIEDFSSEISSELGLPVFIESRGKRPSDKCFKDTSNEIFRQTY